MAHERFLQGRDLPIGGTAAGEHLIGPALHGTSQPAKVFVLLEGEAVAGHSPLPQLLQREGQQGQGIAGGGVTYKGIAQPQLQPQPHPPGGPFDHLAEARLIHRPERHRLAGKPMHAAGV